MKPLSRNGVHKRGSARAFNHRSGRSKAINLAPPPMRGGFRI